MTEDELRERERLAEEGWQPEIFPQPEPVVYTLNAGQQSAFDWLVPFCLSQKDNRAALLEGYAGTGKTFLLNRVVEKVRSVDPRIAFGITAPTHKAVRQAKKHSANPKTFDFGTIHSFLGLKQVKDEWTGEVSYKREYLAGQPRRIEGIHVLIVDEVSMLDDTLYEHIQEELRSNDRLVVLYTGDPLQIPPVGQKKKTGVALSKPFNPSIQHSHKIHRLVLTEPQRQAADSPIIMYAHTIRDQNKRQFIDFKIKPEYHHALEQVPLKGNKEGIFNLFKTYFNTQEFNENTDYIKVVAWTNKTVDYFNKVIRQLIYKQEVLPKIMLNEKLVIDKPFVRNEKVVLANNEDVEVVEACDATLDFRYKLPKGQFFEDSDMVDPLADVTQEGYLITFKTYLTTLLVPETGEKYKVHIIHESDEEKYHKLRGEFEKAAKGSTDTFIRKDMWKQFYKVEEKFAWVKYNYCLTGHKSQGSTYDYCISMEWDMDTNFDIEERNRIKYVAASRAKHKLFIVK